jgi:hypothetical protein
MRYARRASDRIRTSTGRGRQLTRLARGVRGFLETPIDHELALASLTARIRNREDNFLLMVKRFISEHPGSPYRALLRHAGWDEAKLAASIRRQGLEATLARLRDSGVYLTYEELKGRRPIVRGSLVIDVADRDFDNPLLLGKGVGGTTSGSTSRPSRVGFDWAGLAEESANNLVLREIHGIEAAPLALWLPLPPGIAGVHSLLVNAKMGRPPERWFSPVADGLPGTSLVHRHAVRYLAWSARRAGVTLPRPEPLRLDSARVVARWLQAALEGNGSAVLRTSASTAVRVAEAAAKHQINVAGSAVLAGGEPLTAPRRRAIEATGMRAVPRYASAELGLMAGLCGQPQADDDMHVYLDRLAVATLERPMGEEGQTVDSLLFTSLSLNSGKVFLNAELGDHATVEHRDCGCAFGKLGMNLHVSRVRSHDKLTGEGMGLLAAQLDDAVATVVARAGGGPNDYQFWERSDDRGPTRLVVAVSPEIRIDDSALVESILDELRDGTPAETLASQMWREAGTLQVVRVRPRSRYKMPPILKR